MGLKAIGLRLCTLLSHPRPLNQGRAQAACFFFPNERYSQPDRFPATAWDPQGFRDSLHRPFGRLLKGAADENSNLEAGRKKVIPAHGITTTNSFNVRSGTGVFWKLAMPNRHSRLLRQSGMKNGTSGITRHRPNQNRFCLRTSWKKSIYLGPRYTRLAMMTMSGQHLC